MTLYRVTAVAIVDTVGEAIIDGKSDAAFCEIERASMRGLDAIASRDVVSWYVERLDPECPTGGTDG